MPHSPLHAEAAEVIAEAAWNHRSDERDKGLPLWEAMIFSEEDAELVEERRAESAAALSALLALLAQRGWQIVPKEATEEMLGAALSVPQMADPMLPARERLTIALADEYAAMLAACADPLGEVADGTT